MSKCWYCNNELTSEENQKHFGICDKCYAETESWNTVLGTLANKIAELQKQLEEKEKKQEKTNKVVKQFQQRVKYFRNENERLEKQLKSQPAEIVEKIKVRFLATCQIKQGNDEMIASFQTFNRCLDTILKEYQK